MRILYIGQLWSGGTCAARLHTLSQLGMPAISFDVTPYLRMGTGIEQSLQSRLKAGRGIRALNRSLEARASEGDFDVVWVDKGVQLYPATLEILKAAARKRFAVHYTPDAQILDNRSRHFDTCIPIYDLVVTTKPFEVEAYRQLGAREVELVLQGYGRQFVPRLNGSVPDSRLHSDVCFIGHCQRHYAGRLRAASQTTSGLKVWGPRWPRYARWNGWARLIVQGEGLWDKCYPEALRSTKIALGLLSKFIPETTTTRTFEIPACGTFMLAERTDEHLSLFDEGKEAEYFESDEELCDKIRFYLANDNTREAIAQAGRERCLKSGYNDQHQLRRVLERVAKLIASV
ncbi:MAG: glycosyltransferase [Hyphomicrobium sp.]